VTGNVTTTDGVWYQVSFSAGDTVHFDVDINSGQTLRDAEITLYDANLMQIGYNDDSGEGLTPLLNHTFVQSGTYYVQVTDWGSTLNTGTFTLHMSVQDEISIITPPEDIYNVLDVNDFTISTDTSTGNNHTDLPTATVTGNVNTTNGDWYQVDFSAGNTVHFDVDINSGQTIRDAVITLYDANLTQIGYNYDPVAGNTPQLEQSFSQSGTYYVQISTTGPILGSATYTLNISVDDTTISNDNLILIFDPIHYEIVLFDGGEGFDNIQIDDNFDSITMGISADGTVIVRNSNDDGDVEANEATLINIEQFDLGDQTFDVDSLLNNDNVRPLFGSQQLTDGAYANEYLLPDVFYSGNAGLDALYDYQYFGNNDAGDILVASDDNDFINGFGGDDAINTGAGNDIIDGGLGSNFLTGGTGNDTFFSDGREAGNGAITWSTVTDFTDGTNAVNIWGYIDGTSTYEWYADAGATGWTGATLHADLDGNGTIDTSMTFTGMDIADMSTPQGLEVGGNGYLLIG
jgi:hypothetical protein